MGHVFTKRAALALATALAAATPAAVHAQAVDKVKVGMIATLSGQSAVLGQHSRDGFQLAIKTLGGKLGDLPAEVIVADDELKPDVGVSRARALVERDGVNFVVGPIFSNVLQAILKPVADAKTFLISPNAGTSNFAGRQCSPYFFVTSYQNDQSHEVMGRHAQDQNMKRVYLIAPNYQAGRDSLAGFKRHFKGEVVDEVYVPLGTLDFQAEIAKIASARPEAVFVFMPGGMGVNFVRQFRQAGLADRMAFLSAFTVDESTLPAQGDAALGFFGGSNWAPNLDTPENKAFVAAFEKEYGYVPAAYAFYAYDAAMLLDSVVRKVKGNLKDENAVRAALKAADFKSLRGDFKFNTNGYPIQDFYVVRVAKRADGKFQTEIDRKVFDDHADAYVGECPLK